ncbi:MAG: sulfatase-like hydrolase/transferase, partial [Candidatus Sumerlaeota bacterium]|nr:sulfatase-like hydrolase/transferase [Candidatus Sumerlaeota bacterium]
MDRREFLKSVAAGAAVASLPGAFSAAAESAAPKTDRKPNILVIMTDEHQAAVTGCYGNTIVQTPNLDGLAKRGVVFEAAYTNSPLCVPCRLSFTSG